MKSITIVSAAVLLNLLLVRQTSGQTAMTAHISKPEFKHELMYFIPAVPGNDSRLNLINTRAVRHFMTAFQGVTGENWKLLENGLSATFSTGSIKTMVVYNKQGEWSYTLRMYKEDGLSQDIRRLVRSAYFDYTIVAVNEVQKEGVLIYEIHMLDDSNARVLEVVDGMIRADRFFKRKVNEPGKKR